MRKLREHDGQQQPVTFLRTALLKIGRSEGKTKELAWCRCIRCVQVGGFAVSDSMNIMLRSFKRHAFEDCHHKAEAGQQKPAKGRGKWAGTDPPLFYIIILVHKHVPSQKERHILVAGDRNSL